jgi:hypothetical protein
LLLVADLLWPLPSVPAWMLKISTLTLASNYRPCQWVAATSSAMCRLDLPDLSCPLHTARRVFNAVHCLAHPGIRASRRLISSRFVWPKMKRDIGAWCRDCQSCAKGKVTKQLATAITPIPVPEKGFSHVHVYIVGPCPHHKRDFVTSSPSSTGPQDG